MDERRHGRDVTDEEACEVDHVSAEVAERTGAGGRGIEAPRVQRRIVAPVLQVAAAEVADLAELAGLDDLAGESNSGDEAVVERAEVLDAGCLDPLPDVVALVGITPERLLAENVLARFGCGDRRLRVERVRAAVVEQADRRVADDVAPVGRPPLVPVALGRSGDGLLIAACDRNEPRHQRRWPRHVLDLPERVRVGLAHECVPEHADPDLVDLADRRNGRLRPDPGLLIAHCVRSSR